MRNVACVGAGLIGWSWAQAFARSGARVRVFDPSPERRSELSGDLAPGVSVVDALAAAVHDADYIQESVPENPTVKAALYEELESLAPDSAIIASSTSELTPSRLFEALRTRNRCLVAHPLNPPHLIPAVEVCPAPFTDAEVTGRTMDFMRVCGQKPALVQQEVKGFIMNRLQLAVLREALSLVARGVCSVEDLDSCMKYGIGLRWAAMGPFETNFLSTTEGYSHFLIQYRETMVSIMNDLAEEYCGNDVLGKDIDAQLEKLLNGLSREEVEQRRDRTLERLQLAQQEPTA